MKTLRVLAFDIQYDTDDVSVDWLRDQGAYLPNAVMLEVDWDGTEDGSYAVADAISDVTGFCVLSFDFKAYTS